MSNFITKIPVDVEGVKRQLPPDSDFEKIVWDDKNKVIEFHWSNRSLQHPYTILEYSWPDLQEKKLPSCVKIRERVVAPPLVETPTPPKAIVDKPRHRGVRRVQ